jgi:hypothetical protein
LRFLSFFSFFSRISFSVLAIVAVVYVKFACVGWLRMGGLGYATGQQLVVRTFCWSSFFSRGILPEAWRSQSTSPFPVTGGQRRQSRPQDTEIPGVAENILWKSGANMFCLCADADSPYQWNLRTTSETQVTCPAISTYGTCRQGNLRALRSRRFLLSNSNLAAENGWRSMMISCCINTHVQQPRME